MSLAFDYSGFKTLLLAAMLPPAPMLLLAAWGGWRLKQGRRGGGWMLGMALALVWLCWRLGGAWLAADSLALSAIVLLVLIQWRKGRKQLSAALLVAGAVAVMLIPHMQEQGGIESEAGLIPAKPFSEAALAEARASGKPVFVWFTADWCLTCKVNENLAIERDATRDAFAKAGVVALKGDWTTRDPAITRFLTAQGAGGIPLYLWYKPGADAQQLPQVLTPGSLVELAQAS